MQFASATARSNLDQISNHYHLSPEEHAFIMLERDRGSDLGDCPCQAVLGKVNTYCTIYILYYSKPLNTVDCSYTVLVHFLPSVWEPPLPDADDHNPNH